MGVRRQGREIALQALYRMEMTGDESPSSLALLWEHFEAPASGRRFAEELLRGVQADRPRIDQLLADAAENWRLGRLSRVDLNVLRIATYELLHGDERVPTRVVIDEAIEIARRFGGEESSSFVNGVLDQIAAALGLREQREARPRDDE